MKIDSQISFDFSGSQLRDAGLSLAVESAERKIPNWKNQTYELFKEFLKQQREPFMMESFRSWLAMIDDYEFPDNLRAFGCITVRALKEGLIKQIGTRKVKNSRAHCANAALLVKI